MRYVALTEPMSREFVEAYMEEHGLPDILAEFLAKHVEQPQEDFFAVAPDTGTFVVSDGVTLDTRALLEHGKGYPHPSPSGDVARTFSQAIIAQRGSTDLINMFRMANRAVAPLATAEESEYGGNPTGRFAATAAFIVMCETSLDWARICDCSIAHYDATLHLKHYSGGDCAPYAVVNGEEHMTEHLTHGTWDTTPGDTILLTTDGFEPYLQNQGFLDLFTEGSLPTQEDIAQHTARKNTEDPLRFGHERTLIAVRL